MLRNEAGAPVVFLVVHRKPDIWPALGRGDLQYGGLETLRSFQHEFIDVLDMVRLAALPECRLQRLKGEDLRTDADRKPSEGMANVAPRCQVQVDQPIQFLDVREWVVGGKPHDVAEAEVAGATEVSLQYVILAAPITGDAARTAELRKDIVPDPVARRHDNVRGMLQRAEPRDYEFKQRYATYRAQHLSLKARRTRSRLDDYAEAYFRSSQVRTSSADRSRAAIRPTT